MEHFDIEARHEYPLENLSHGLRAEDNTIFPGGYALSAAILETGCLHRVKGGFGSGLAVEICQSAAYRPAAALAVLALNHGGGEGHHQRVFLALHRSADAWMPPTFGTAAAPRRHRGSNPVPGCAPAGRPWRPIPPQIQRRPGPVPSFASPCLPTGCRQHPHDCRVVTGLVAIAGHLGRYWDEFARTGQGDEFGIDHCSGAGFVQGSAGAIQGQVAGLAAESGTPLTIGVTAELDPQADAEGLQKTLAPPRRCRGCVTCS